MEATENSTKADKPWLFKKGQSGNPGGRPKNTMKDYLSRKFSAMSDEEKEAWLEKHKVTGVDQIKFGEGNPSNETDITSAGQAIQVIVPAPVAEAFNINATNPETIGSNPEQGQI